MENSTELFLINHEHNKNWRRFSTNDLCVDFVLAYEEPILAVHNEKREFFEKSLETVGFIMEKEVCQKVTFVKIHAPKEVLLQYAEVLKIKLPIKKVHRHLSLKNVDDLPERENKNIFNVLLIKFLKYFRIQLDPQKFPPKKTVLSSVFSNDKHYLFDVDSENIFCTAARIEIVAFILQRTKFGQEEYEQGIRNLVNEGVYNAAFPLHDGDIFTEGSQRKLLYDEWAKIRNCIKFQPLEHIKEYFGVKVGFYFAWLGFYTYMLISTSVVGLVCFLYGLLTLPGDTLVKEICSSTAIMCPLCDKNCDYWKLSDTCTYSKVVHVIDNSATIFFAIFMSFWAALYLELWKRYSAGVAHKWGLTGFGAQCEPPRPEYSTKLAKSNEVKRNAITGKLEPRIPFWRVRLPSIFLSFSISLFWVFLAVAVIFGIIIYRMAIMAVDKMHGDRMVYSEYVLPLTSGILNLIGIFVLNIMYNFLAVKLTELELRRTQTEYEDSLTLKIYMFKFVNYYSCIFYIAFFKGKFSGYPVQYNRLFGYRQEECNPGGCLVELTVQLCIIMIGKQVLNSFLEMLKPILYKTYNSFKQRTGLSKVESEQIIICNRCTEDYTLSDMERQGLFTEYLEIVLQYGFILIFVTAFPLAPLFALINNIFELRLDAHKWIKYYRRPVPQRVRDIGVWLPIMDLIGRISILSNAFIIAFSSHFIPQLIYYIQNDRRNLHGYLNFTLAQFNVDEFPYGVKPQPSIYNVTTCSYMEFGNPLTSELKYTKSATYWHILAARFAFVVVYSNVVGFVILVVQYAIPDITKKLDRLIQTENYRKNEIIIKHETDKAKMKLRKAEIANESMNKRTIIGDVYSKFYTQGITHLDQDEIELIPIKYIKAQCTSSQIHEVWEKLSENYRNELRSYYPYLEHYSQVLTYIDEPSSSDGSTYYRS